MTFLWLVTGQSNHTVHPGQKYYEGFFLEEEYSNSKGIFFRIVGKNAFVRKSIIYPLVQFLEKNNKLFIPIQDYVEILMYVEENVLISL